MPSKTKNQPILVPVDFSSHSEAALLKACELAECTGQSITILHVVHDPGDMPGYYKPITKKKRLQRIQDMAREMFEKFLADISSANPQLKSLKKADTLLVTGLPVTRILEVVESEKASMVVMGSQGRTGLDRMLLGSKAEQVVRLCPVPVTIVKT